MSYARTHTWAIMLMRLCAWFRKKKKKRGKWPKSLDTAERAGRHVNFNTFIHKSQPRKKFKCVHYLGQKISQKKTEKRVASHNSRAISFNILNELDFYSCRIHLLVSDQALVINLTKSPASVREWEKKRRKHRMRERMNKNNAKKKKKRKPRRPKRVTNIPKLHEWTLLQTRFAFGRFTIHSMLR